MVETQIEVRKQPVQARSKARVEAILNAAKEIISDVGSDGMKMNALAQRAEVPIGTVYQFFPNKSAVIHTLVRETMDDLSEELRQQFQDVESLEDAVERLEGAISGYCQYLRDAPVVSDILSSTQGDKNLQALDREDSKRNGDMLFDQLKTYIQVADHDAFRVMCFLNSHLTGSVARISASVDDATAAAMQAQFIASVRRDMLAFA